MAVVDVDTPKTSTLSRPSSGPVPSGAPLTAFQERSRKANLDLVANSPVRRPRSCTTSKTLGTYSPAESCTVVPGSSLKTTPVPWTPSTRRLVTIEVWLGRVWVRSTTVRALSVDAP